MPDDASQPVASPAAYTNAERSVRIHAYIWQAVLASLIGSVTSMAAMSDEQLNHTSILRWVFAVALLILGATLAGWNAFRAAIDRSTSAPGNDQVNPANPPKS